ncbi:MULTISPECIES: IclR family transcriptional regulator [unclassified Leucobacter]|uniref:IclR family transcriptional regulator n=1 Tax=unclassified Leucobacter TaxID=2621730 RepID=UPI00165E5336|nr:MULTISPECIES: IclR family transcriptional regulator [unclassified Leucobacter]MBC9936546.1 IclR family transcriptional regulator [Leucobacter sp. cx-87]
MTKTGAGSPALPAGVQSVERAFALLEALASAEGELALANAAAAAGLALPTAHRLLKTMQSLGYVRQVESRSYGLGPGLVHLGLRATPSRARIAMPIMQELEEISQETVNLAELNGDYVAYIGQVPSRHQMRMFTEVGREVLPHASGVGKAILSTLSEATVRRILDSVGMPRYTDATVTEVEALLEQLRMTQSRGFAIDDGEREVGVRCIAVPIPHSRSAISISGPAARITDAEARICVEALQRAAVTLAELFAGSR